MKILILFLAALTMVAPAAAQDAAMQQEIMQAYEIINKAFETQDTQTIEAMSTPDHIVIIPAYGGAKSLSQTIDTVPKMKVTQKPVGEMAITALAPNVALQTFKAEMDGTYDGQPLARMVVITMIWQKQNGAWKQRLYQKTPIGE